MPQWPLGLLQVCWKSWEEKQQYDDFQKSITSEGQAACGELHLSLAGQGGVFYF